MSLLDAERYRDLAARLAPGYAAADPFPHAVIDDFLPPGVCEEVLAEFPGAKGIDWLRFDKHHSKKLATRGDDQFGPATRRVLGELGSAGCLRFLQTLTGITGLVPDPYFEGAGSTRSSRAGSSRFTWTSTTTGGSGWTGGST